MAKPTSRVRARNRDDARNQINSVSVPRRVKAAVAQARRLRSSSGRHCTAAMPAATSATVIAGNHGKPGFRFGDVTALADGAPDVLPTFGLGSGIFSFTVRDR